MTQPGKPASITLDYDTTIIGALELGEKKWVLAVQLPGVKRHTRHVLGASGEDLALLIERLKARAAAAGHPVAPVILTHEAGRDGFWLARYLIRRGVEVCVMQPSSLPVDRRARRPKTDVIDDEMLLRALMAWLRGEPRVCSMVPVPSEADEEARRAHREREELTGDRRSILNKIDGILATLGVKGLKGIYTLTSAGRSNALNWRHETHFLRPPSISAGHHQACDLALSSLYVKLSRRRGSPC
jgi:transposase